MNLSAKEKLRSSIPNISVLRRIITNQRINFLNRDLMPISMVETLEKNPDNLREYISKWEDNHSVLAQKFNSEIREIIKYNPSIKAHEDWENILLDCKFCKYAYGFLPYEYICYQLREKNIEERKSFVSDLERIKLIYQMNNILEVKLFMDKSKTYDMFKKYYRRECIAIEKKSDLKEFQEFVRKYPQFVKKLVFESVGNSVELIDTKYEECDVKSLFNHLISQGKHILEEKIVQSKRMSMFNATSVNTVRCITAKTREGVLIPFTFLKAGRKGSFVDNGGAGGVLVGIDENTGITNTNGVDEYAVRYDKHPDNGLFLKGVQLPDWNQMKSICREMASKIDSIQFIGWDMAHTDKEGWIVVEGNGGSQFIGPQCTSVYGIRERLDELMKHMTLFC